MVTTWLALWPPSAACTSKSGLIKEERMVRPKAIKDWCLRIDQWSPLATIYFLLYQKSWLPAAFIILSLWLFWPAEKRKEKDKIRPVNNHLKERIRRQDSFSCKLLRWAQFLSPLSFIFYGPSVKLREWMTFSYFLFTLWLHRHPLSLSIQDGGDHKGKERKT